MVYVIRTELVPSWSCSQTVSKLVWHIPLLCVQWKTLDDRQRNSPKHVDYYSKRNKFEKFVHLVGFIMRMHQRYLCIPLWGKTLKTFMIWRVQRIHCRGALQGVAWIFYSNGFSMGEFWTILYLCPSAIFLDFKTFNLLSFLQIGEFFIRYVTRQLREVLLRKQFCHKRIENKVSCFSQHFK